MNCLENVGSSSVWFTRKARYKIKQQFIYQGNLSGKSDVRNVQTKLCFQMHEVINIHYRFRSEVHWEGYIANSQFEYAARKRKQKFSEKNTAFRMKIHVTFSF